MGNDSITVGGAMRVAGRNLPSTYALPTPDGGIRTRHADLSDRIGDAVQTALPWMLMTSVAGGIVSGQALAGGSKLRGIAFGLLGSGVAGAAALAGVIGVRTLVGGQLRPRTGTAGKPLPTPEDAIAGAEHVRVMTFNLHGGQGVAGHWDPTDQMVENIARAIEREHPDVVLLQESDHDANRSVWHDDLKQLDERLRADGAVGAAPVINVSGRAQEVAVMTFNGFRVDNARNLEVGAEQGYGIGRRFDAWLGTMRNNPIATHLPLPAFQPPKYGPFMPRNALDTIVRTPGGSTIRVLTSHLSWGSSIDPTLQQRQLGMVATDVDAWKGPTIYGGDFNTASKDGNYAQETGILGGAGLRDTFSVLGIGPTDPRRATSPSGNGIDRIYVSNQWRVNEVHADDALHWASDHNAVVADLTLQPTPKHQPGTGGAPGPVDPGTVPSPGPQLPPTTTGDPEAPPEAPADAPTLPTLDPPTPADTLPKLPPAA